MQYVDYFNISKAYNTRLLADNPLREVRIRLLAFLAYNRSGMALTQWEIDNEGSSDSLESDLADSENLDSLVRLALSDCA